jgi:hypothetical protein
MNGKLKSALSEAEVVLAERNKIREAIKRAEAERPHLEAAIDEAKAGVGAEEATAALSGEQAKAGPARKRLRDAREELEALDARIPALEARLGQTDQRVLDAKAQLQGPLSQFGNALIAERTEAYRTAAEKVREAVIALRATAAALGGTLPYIDLLSLPDPNGHSEYMQIVDTNQDRMTNDPAFAEAYGGLASHGKVSQSLNREAVEIVRVRQKAEQDAKEAELTAKRSSHVVVQEFGGYGPPVLAPKVPPATVNVLDEVGKPIQTSRGSEVVQ